MTRPIWPIWKGGSTRFRATPNDTFGRCLPTIYYYGTTYLPMPQQLPLCTTFLFPTTLSLFMSLQIPPPLESPNHHAPATHTLRELAFNRLHVLSTIIYRLSASLAHLGITSKRLTTQTYLPNPLLAQVAVHAWCSAWNGPYAPLKTRGGPQRPMHGQPMPATRTCCLPAALQQICARASHLLRSHRLVACGPVRAWGIPGFCQSSLNASARWVGAPDNLDVHRDSLGRFCVEGSEGFGLLRDLIKIIINCANSGTCADPGTLVLESAATNKGL